MNTDQIAAPKLDGLMVEWALYYASLGIPVFPLGVRSKEPLISTKNGGRGCLDATTDPAEIRGWWKAQPNANIGAATGFKFDVLDIDEDGEESLLAHPPIRQTTEVRCPSGGSHIYFEPSLVPLKGTVAGFEAGLDFRSKGGYVVLPPSYVVVRPNPASASPRKQRGYEGRYTWIRPLEPGLPPVPMWIVDKIKRGADYTGDSKPPEEIKEGKRNDTLFRAACWYRRFSATEFEILAVLKAMNQGRCRPPLSDDDVERIARSAAKYKPERLPPNCDMPDSASESEARSGLIGAFKTHGKPAGVGSGFDFIDCNTTCEGWPNGQMSVVTAYTGTGKSAFMLQSAYRIAKAGHPVCYATVADLTGENLFDRLVKNLSGWYGGEEPLDPLLAERWHLARNEISALPIHVYDVSELRYGRDVETLCEWVRANSSRFNVLICDYGQELQSAKARSEYDHAEIASAELRWLAAQTKLPVVVGSQITEGNAKQGTRDITKGSRKWEERAGLMLKLKVLDDDERTRAEEEVRGIKGLTVAHLVKNRYGKRNIREYWQWLDEYARFEEL